MSQNRINMGVCPHLGYQHVSLYELKHLEKGKSCASCDYGGPNLWICLKRNCLHIGCSEQANDHSTEHFQRNNSHCIHLNLSSQRAWCYMCEREVLILRNHQRQGMFAMPSKTSQSIDTDEEDDEDEAEPDTEYAGLVGLQNIANTCYMNSALQALSNVQPMTHYFLNCGDLVDHLMEQSAYRNKVGLAKSYQRLVRDIWCRSVGGGKNYIAPRGILYGIRSVHPMFRGFLQHDTQEFLRCFMDQLHEELKEQEPTTTENGDVKSPESGAGDNEESVSQSSRSSSCSSMSETEYETCDSSISDQSNKVQRDNAHGRRSRRSTKTSSATQAQSQPAMRSIISDVFDGKLLSSVQCLTCDRVSTREETFQDLSLPIPNRDYVNMLHQSHSASAQNLNSMDKTVARANEGWVPWFWSFLRSWLWGPSVTLHDCMSSFFSADELKGDNMYSCEKCKKLRTGVKYSQILDLPEVLCIHLKRFRHDLSYSSKISAPVQFLMDGFDMRPYLHKDCKSSVTLYKLVSVICHHGTVGGGHYTCFARNNFTDRWYEYDDQHVTEVPASVVQNCQAYVLFYSKYNPQMDLLRAEANELSLSNPVHLSDIRFYVAREWLSRFSTFAEPGPINNWSMLCPHGGLLQSKISLLSQIAVPISQPLWDFLYRNFGGGPAINMLFECETCKWAAEALARRQYYELSVFTKYNGPEADLDTNAIYAISMPWLRRWQQFARGLTQKEPGPISNANIATADLKVRPGSDYAQLSAPLWRFLFGIYAGGPEIIIRGPLTEEIEIIDQDEYDIGDDGPDLSDTESNLGNGNTAEVHEEPEPDAVPTPANDVPKDDEKDKIEEYANTLKTLYINSREIRHGAKHLMGSSKKVIRKSLRKKSTKSRSALKNADLFGPKGSYSVHKSCNGGLEEDNVATLDTHSTTNTIDGSNANTTTNSTASITSDNEVKRSAFRKKSKQSFHFDKHQRNHLRNSLPEQLDDAISEQLDTSSSHVKTKARRSRESVTLQKFSQLQEPGEATETEA